MVHFPKIALLAVVSVWVLVAQHAARAEDEQKPTTTLSATDLEGIKAHLGKNIAVEGTVESAKWSASGKVLLIEFKGNDKKGFNAAHFSKDKEALDQKFDGNFPAAITGKNVRITGRIEEYRGRLQIIISRQVQIDIIHTDPVTRPS